MIIKRLSCGNLMTWLLLVGVLLTFAIPSDAVIDPNTAAGIWNFDSGLVLYVFDGEVYVGGWNRAEYNWNGAWPSAPVKSKTWYHVGLVIRNAKGKVEKGKFEMWLNGELIAKESGGQLHAHSDDIGIGYVNQNTVFHDDDGSGSDIHWFGGLIDEVAVYNSALEEADFRELASPVLSIEPEDNFTATWGAIKAQRMGQ